MTRKKVSVIIPVYNRYRKIQRALESAMNQTYDNIEITVVDDGSNDGTSEELSKYRNEKINVISLNKNHGVATARNIGIERSNGEYVSFLDSDDEWSESKIEKQVEYISDLKKEVALVDCNWNVKIDNEYVAMKRQQGPTNKTKLLSFDHICSPPTVLLRRSVLNEVGLFDANMATAEDADLWFRISKSYRFEHIPQALVTVHRGHNNRLGRDPYDFLKGHLYFYSKHRDDYNSEPGSTRSGFFFHIGHRLLSMGLMGAGRKYLLRSIYYDYLNLKPYAFIILSLLGNKFFLKVKDIKNKLLRLI